MVDYSNLNPKQRRALRGAVMGAFKREELIIFLSDHSDDIGLRTDRDELTTDGEIYELQLHKLLDAAMREGWIERFVAKLMAERSRAPAIVKLKAEFETQVEPLPATDGQRPPPQPPTLPKTIVVLGAEDVPATPDLTAEVSKLVNALQARNLPFAAGEEWGDGWPNNGFLPDAAAWLQRRPLFVRTLAGSTGTQPREAEALIIRLLGRFGLAALEQLRACPRLLWRPGWPLNEPPPEPPDYVSAEPAEVLAARLAELLGVPGGEPDTVIHFENPKENIELSNKFEPVVRKGLNGAVGVSPKPELRGFGQGRIGQILPRLSKVPNTGVRVLALNDFDIPQPPTRNSTIEFFSLRDRAIDDIIGSRANVVRVAVLVHTAEEFIGETDFGADNLLSRWCLFPLSKTSEGAFEYDPKDMAWIKAKVDQIRTGNGAA
jgi:hypothetical protein